MEPYLHSLYVFTAQCLIKYRVKFAVIMIFRIDFVSSHLIIKGNIFILYSLVLFIFESCALLGHYAASSGNSLQTFRDNLSVPTSRVKNRKKEKTAQL